MAEEIKLGKGTVEICEGIYEDKPSLFFVARKTIAPIEMKNPNAEIEITLKDALALFTFENVESLDVFIETLLVLRSKHFEEKEE